MVRDHLKLHPADIASLREGQVEVEMAAGIATVAPSCATTAGSSASPRRAHEVAWPRPDRRHHRSARL